MAGVPVTILLYNSPLLCGSNVPIKRGYSFSPITASCLLCTAVRISGTEYVEQGESIRLQCNASGKPDPPHDLHWLQDDNPVRSDPSSGVLVAKKIETKYLLSVFTIERSRFSDAGEYVCVTSNDDTASMVVHVLTGTSTSAVHRRRTSNVQT